MAVHDPIRYHSLDSVCTMYKLFLLSISICVCVCVCVEIYIVYILNTWCLSKTRMATILLNHNNTINGMIMF